MVGYPDTQCAYLFWLQADAEHIRLADQFVEVPGGGNHNNYANVKLIIEIAKRAGVEAVWPGW